MSPIVTLFIAMFETEEITQKLICRYLLSVIFGYLAIDLAARES